MINRKDLTLTEIKELMKPISSPNHNHTALINPSEGRRAINLALLRWAGGAKQITLTQYELPPDAVGRIYVVDTFIGEVVDVKYADWAKHVRKGKYKYTGTSHTKGEYKTFPHVMLDYVDGSKKRRHYRPMMHTIIAYVYPALREQYAQAVLLDMADKDRTFLEAQVQVNHMDKEVRNNYIYNLEVVTASENNRHSRKYEKGLLRSALLDRKKYIPNGLMNFYGYGYMDIDREYLNKLCRYLSDAEISPDVTGIRVKRKDGTISTIEFGRYLTSWDILWGIVRASGGKSYSEVV